MQFIWKANDWQFIFKWVGAQQLIGVRIVLVTKVHYFSTSVNEQSWLVVSNRNSIYSVSFVKEIWIKILFKIALYQQ